MLRRNSTPPFHNSLIYPAARPKQQVGVFSVPLTTLTTLYLPCRADNMVFKGSDDHFHFSNYLHISADIL
jgi:hypothetical protein